MPPLPPGVSKVGLVKGYGGWNNSSLSRRSNTISGLLSTRTSQSTGNSGGGILNPSLGIGVISEAMPKGATGSWVPRPISLARPVGPAVRTINVGGRPRNLALDAANNRLYVANTITTDMNVIDTTDDSVTTISLAPEVTYNLALDGANNRLYTVNINTNNVSVIDTSTNPPSVVGTPIAVGIFAFGMALDAGNSRLYVANGGDDNVSVIDTSTNPPSVDPTPIAVGDASFAFALDAANNRLYVAKSNDNSVSVVDTTSKTITNTIPVGNRPLGLALDAANNRLYTANSDGGSVSVIDTTGI